MHILVTGASGFLGRHLVPRLRDVGKVTLLHRPGHPVPRENEGCHILEADLLDPLPDLQADVVFHLAAEADPRRCEQDPVHALRLNTEATLRLLHATQNQPRFVHVSTGQVFGPTPDLITEERPPDPRNTYGASKLAAENFIMAAHRTGRVDGTVVRPFNLYGPGQVGPYVVPELMAQLRRGRVLLHSLDPVRDFTYVEDAADLLARCATDKQASGETFHIASGASRSIGDLARVAARVAGVDEVEGRTPGRPGDVVRVDPGKAQRLLGWRATTPMEEGLARTWQAAQGA